MSTSTRPKWNIKADYVETCNCDYGCPCIIAKVDGKKSSFSVPGVIDVQIDSFKNPVTGEEQDTQIQLPNGFIWKLAHAAKSRVMRILTPSLNFDDSGKNAFYSVVEHKGP